MNEHEKDKVEEQLFSKEVDADEMRAVSGGAIYVEQKCHEGWRDNPRVGGCPSSVPWFAEKCVAVVAEQSGLDYIGSCWFKGDLCNSGLGQRYTDNERIKYYLKNECGKVQV